MHHLTIYFAEILQMGIAHVLLRLSVVGKDSQMAKRSEIAGGGLRTVGEEQ